jgi:hypothetical protein
MAKTEENLVVEQWSEQDEVLRRRYEEALAAGLNSVDAHSFAISGCDIGQLRKAVKNGCPPQLIARIVL